ncbi:hypothetical protein RCO28_34640 [Streptomyces sp. LHD-70]|uniref:hypothetical protein n=1 Tax=Streptomyces sp. LHD-70 TaxID=3072140 RepID=UPI00280F794D|nr:hypothetical protein [Streptomyces sp. LHD-70]MDQ8707572.1 hypothetical protein [Streptomyces sp. LHD-70]
MFQRSGRTDLPEKLLRNAVATRPSRYRGPRRRTGFVLHCWNTEFGDVVLAHTVAGEMGMTFPTHALLRELSEGAASLAVVAADYSGINGPNIEAVDAAGPDQHYGINWRELERVLGMPAPYWHWNLRDPELMMNWRPGAPQQHVPVVVVPDPAPLLRLAAEEPDGSHAAIAALSLAREAMWDTAEDAHREITEHVDTMDAPDSIAVAARPLLPHRPEPVAEEILRDGWRTILSRTDILAAQCAQVADIHGASRFFPGLHKVTVDLGCEQATTWASRLLPSPRTALAAPLDVAEGDFLVDPLTDMPAVRIGGGTIETVAPQRLPAHSPLAALTIGRGSVWVTCEDGTVFVAPQVASGYTYGYAGGGPTALARLIDLLLKDITNPAPGHTAQRPPAGLGYATEVGWKGRTPPFTLTRAELEALRDA